MNPIFQQPARKLSPENLPPGFNHKVELPALIFHRNRIARDRRCKPALRTESQPVKRDVAARLPNTLSQVFDLFQRSSFGCDETQDYKFVIRYLFQRKKRAGTGVVELKQETLRFCLPKKTRGNRPVIPFGQPPAALIASSDVKREGNFWKALHDGVVQINSQAEPLGEAPPLVFIKPARPWVEQ